MIQTVLSWLSGYPGLESLTPERLAPEPGSAGLFCLGRQLLRRDTDILGNEKQRLRISFRLAVHCADSAMPQRLLNLARWVEDTAPVLGEDQTVFCGNGKLTRENGHGTARYETGIIFEFTEVV